MVDDANSNQPEVFLPPEVWWKILSYVSSADLCRVTSTSRYLYSVATDSGLWSRLSFRPNRKKVTSDGMEQMFSVPRFKKMRKLDLKYMRLDPELLEELFNCILSLKVKLEQLDLYGNDLSTVPSDVIAGATPKLKKINLTATKLTTSQVIELLTASVSSTTLEDINLGGNNLRSVPGDIIAGATSRLKKIDLGYTHLTSSQLTEILTACVSSTTLEYINIKANDIRSVPTDIVTRAKSRPRLNLLHFYHF